MKSLIIISMIFASTFAFADGPIVHRNYANGSTCPSGVNPDANGLCDCPSGFFEDGEFCRRIRRVNSENDCPTGFKDSNTIFDGQKNCVYNARVPMGMIQQNLVNRPSISQNPNCEQYIPGSFAPHADVTGCRCPKGYVLNPMRTACIKSYPRSRYGCQNNQSVGQTYCPCPNGYYPHIDRARGSSLPPYDHMESRECRLGPGLSREAYTCHSGEVRVSNSMGMGYTTKYQIQLGGRNRIVLEEASNASVIAISYVSLNADNFCRGPVQKLTTGPSQVQRARPNGGPAGVDYSAGDNPAPEPDHNPQ